MWCKVKQSRKSRHKLSPHLPLRFCTAQTGNCVTLHKSVALHKVTKLSLRIKASFSVNVSLQKSNCICKPQCTEDKGGSKKNQGRMKTTRTTHRFYRHKKISIWIYNATLSCPSVKAPMMQSRMKSKQMMRMLQMVEEMKTWCGVRAENSGYKAVPGVARDRSD